MAFLISLLIGIQILGSLAVSPPRPQPPPPPPDRLLSPSCNSSSVKAAADLALEKLNADRREGYVLGLQRIFDVRQLLWQGTGFVYYLTLDVLETDCHVLSRKSWKDCAFRHEHETVYGQCKATFYINKPRRILHLYNYDCVLRPLPASEIVRTCPDCPTPDNPTEPKFWEAATLSLAKFNKESNQTHYFNIRNVTRASSQWVVGPSDFVDYVIQETSCSKSQAAVDLSKCPFLPDETAEVGVCEGSVIDSQIEHRKFITAKCEIFHPQPLITERHPTGNKNHGHHDDDESPEVDGHIRQRGKGHQKPHRPHDHRPHDHRPHDESPEVEGRIDQRGKGHQKPHHPHGRRPDDHRPDDHHPHVHHHHKHHKHHKNHSQDHADHEQNPPTSSEISTDLGKTVGRVTVLPPSKTHVSLHSLPEIGAERLDGIPVPPESQGPKPKINLPDIHGAPEGSQPLGKPDLTKPAKPVPPPPFPAGFSESDACPGEILVFIHSLEHLLPQRPFKPSPTRAPEFQAKEK